jgi:hypothetical protein
LSSEEGGCPRWQICVVVVVELLRSRSQIELVVVIAWDDELQLCIARSELLSRLVDLSHAFDMNEISRNEA